ncbi:translocation/assembly module TamB domain-containing protein [Shewanella sp. YIC-542]|uniref:autotransporter assembly complex protein TamB n=1 Tax=Shewanella mytili TaxID=3377111 RepID=UPI00398F5BF4
MTQSQPLPHLPPLPPRRPFTLGRFLRWSLRLLVYVPLLLLLLVALLVGTGPGTHLTLVLAEQLVPGLQLSYQNGAINGQLQLKQASWQMPGVSVRSGPLRLQWRPACLLQAQVCVDELHLDHIQVLVDTAALPTTAKPDTDEPQAALQLPVGIQLQSASLQQVKVQVDQMQFNAGQLMLSANWQKNGLWVNRLSSHGLHVMLPNSASAPDAATATAPVAQPEWPLAHLPEIRLPFAVNVQTAQLNDSHITIGPYQQALSELTLQGSFHDEQLTVQRLALNHEYGQGELHGDIRFLGHYPMQLQAKVDIEHLPQLPGLTTQHVTLDVHGSLAQLETRLQLAGEQQATLHGKIDLSRDTLPYQLELENARLHWPLVNPQYIASDFALQSDGTLARQNASLKGQLTTPWLANAALEAALVHQKQQLAVSHFKASTPAGQLTLQGSLDYAKGFAWQAKLGVEELDLAQLSLDVDDIHIPDSSISGQLQTHGHLHDKQWLVALENADLKGSAAKTPFVLSGNFSIDQQWHVQSRALQLTAFNSSLWLDGSAGKHWDLDSRLHVQELALLYPEAQGQLQLTAKVQGDGQHPQLQIKGQARHLQFMDYTLAQAQIQGDYAPLDEHDFTLQLTGDELTLAGQTMDKLTLDANGNLYRQQARLSTQGEQSLQAILSNRYLPEQQQLALSVSELQLSSMLGQWQLTAPANVQWDLEKQQGQLSPFCLHTQANQLCLQRPVALADKGQAQLAYQGEPGQLLSPWLPEGVAWQGKATMAASLDWQPDSKPEATVQLDIAPGVITVPNGRKAAAPIAFDGGYVTAVLDSQQLTTRVAFTAGEILQLHGDMAVGVSPEHPLQGHIRMQRIQLQPLQKLVPQLHTLQGVVDGDIGISGSLQNPLFSGQLQLSDAELVSINNPTQIKQLQLKLQFAGQHATLDGHWQMGDGDAKMQGDVRWPDGRFQGNLTLKGQSLTVIEPPLAILQVSPDIQLSFAPDKLHVSGQVDIPSGKISIVPLPDGGVALSDDVVFDDTIAKAQARTTPMAISADLALNVGNKVAIDGYGLKGMLRGTLKLQQQAYKPAQLFGNIRVLNGSYRFLGQTLSIATGELQFAGPPQMPNLNVEAVRTIKEEDVIAGVRITGTPLKPVVTLFSNPAKEQAEILSYIVQGRGYDSSQNNALMLSAAMAISGQVTGGGQALSNLGNTAAGLVETFGFSNVQLDANDDGKVAISGYLGKNLMLKYGVGVFTPGYEMTVRYYLLSRLYLESVTNAVGQSLDIYYSFDL